jgi:predicted metalloendopeptidase
MKHSMLLVVASAIALTACNTQQGGNASSTVAEGTGLGINPAWMDKSAVPGDDFFGYANGTWVKNTEIPADRSPTRSARRIAVPCSMKSSRPIRPAATRR